MANQPSTTALGINFSHRYAAQIGLDPAEAYLAVLIHLKPPFVRLSLYWDEISPEPGVYDFSTVHRQLALAQQHRCRVLLTVGFKPQRHPAFAPPRWLTSRGSSPQTGRLSANLLLMLERAVALLADYDAIDAWEIEHMPFLSPPPEPDGWTVDRTLVGREIELIGEVDPRHRPVVVSHPAGRRLGTDWRETLEVGDVIGWVWPSSAGARSALPGLFSWLRAQYLTLESRFQSIAANRAGKPCWITELDVEPDMGDNPLKSAGVQELERAGSVFLNSGADRAYLKGAEGWLIMRDRGASEGWNAMRSLLRPQSDW